MSLILTRNLSPVLPISESNVLLVSLLPTRTSLLVLLISEIVAGFAITSKDSLLVSLIPARNLLPVLLISESNLLQVSL